MFRVALLVLLAGLLAVDAQASVNQWSRLGPEGGSILAIATDPATPTTVSGFCSLEDLS